MRFDRKVISFALLAASEIAVAAQMQDAQTAEPRLVDARSTAPALNPCGRSGYVSCFRVLLELRAATDIPVYVSYGGSSSAPLGRVGGTQAYFTSGAVCAAVIISGLDLNWKNTWTQVTRTRPARVAVQFYCDGPVRPGDATLMDFSFWLSAEGYGRRFERFAFPERPVR